MANFLGACLPCLFFGGDFPGVIFSHLFLALFQSMTATVREKILEDDSEVPTLLFAFLFIIHILHSKATSLFLRRGSLFAELSGDRAKVNGSSPLWLAQRMYDFS